MTLLMPFTYVASSASAHDGSSEHKHEYHIDIYRKHLSAFPNKTGNLHLQQKQPHDYYHTE